MYGNIRRVRPSWIDLQVEGRTNSVHTGPKSRTGRLAAQFKVRDKGKARPILLVRFEPNDDGTATTLSVDLANKNGSLKRLCTKIIAQ